MKDWSTSCAGTLKYKPIYSKDGLYMRLAEFLTTTPPPSLQLCYSMQVRVAHSEAKLYQNVGVWSSKSFTAETGKEMDVSCPKPQIP